MAKVELKKPIVEEIAGIIKDAEAQKTQRVNEATAQVARFNAMYEEYIKNPTITKQRMFYETMEEVLPGLKVIIESPSGDVQTFYPIESFANITTNGATGTNTIGSAVNNIGNDAEGTGNQNDNNVVNGQ